MRNKQKFHKGDWVKVAKDLGRLMSHFTGDCEAIVLYSYADRFGSNDTKNYALHLKGRGFCAWYEEHQLEMIESGRLDKLEQWENEAELERKQKSDIDWIFSHGQEVLESAYGASIKSLAACFGLTNLWGNRGEGIVYYQNAIGTLEFAKPYLATGDKTGWLAFCEELKKGADDAE